ncbi:MAG TPA: acetyl-CoA carboxylase biotin carboxyl carrier protein [bacterium]|nr:acetyl-CoA carboxylase biotin carboxyl carrier protein [bacterium]HQO33525.1 acetyl-CoA carboxylase biotin carboxyl carrier protein [bacterium]
MDLDLIRQIIALVEKAEISELELEEEDLRVVVKKYAAPVAVSTAPLQAIAPAPSLPAPSETKPGTEPETNPLEDVNVITSRMVGTFYRASSPDAEPFVEMGSEVREDTVVCILEAMKVMNELKAGFRGKVVAILVENGQPVEYNQPLFHIRKS